MADEDPGRCALAEMDEVLAKRPEADGHALTRLSHYLATLRDRLAPPDFHRAAPDQQQRLSRLNAVISVVMALHFPVGSPPWSEFEQARDCLAELVEGLDAASSASSEWRAP